MIKATGTVNNTQISKSRDHHKPHHIHHSFSSKWAMRKRMIQDADLQGCEKFRIEELPPFSKS